MKVLNKKRNERRSSKWKKKQKIKRSELYDVMETDNEKFNILKN